MIEKTADFKRGQTSKKSLEVGVQRKELDEYRKTLVDLNWTREPKTYVGMEYDSKWHFKHSNIEIAIEKLGIPTLDGTKYRLDSEDIQAFNIPVEYRDNWFLIFDENGKEYLVYPAGYFRPQYAVTLKPLPGKTKGSKKWN